MTTNDKPIFKVEDPEFIPTRANETDAGFDLRSEVDEVIKPGERKLIPTGVRVAIPRGMAGYLTPRSGLSWKEGLTVLNSPGLIDPGYRGIVKANIINHGDSDYAISRGDRIAQITFPRVETEVFLAEGDLPEPEDSRGESGHGSSGKN